MKRAPKLIGKSPPVKELRQFIQKASKSDANVLILGETGVGKEVAARMIHLLSRRANMPFTKCSCPNFNDDLLESELFGHNKGAFTSAFTDKPGLLEEANGGTFFLDEIADISPKIQAKVLSIIEDREIRRLGATKSKEIDVRFILVTNKDLCQLTNTGRFRKDLFYRIGILSFRIVPLRQRKEDIPLLVDFFMERERQKQSRDFTISQGASEKLLAYTFPGNVRELEYVIERAAALSNGTLITEHDIVFQEIIQKPKNRHKTRYSPQRIIDALVRHQGNKTRAAQELGISRVHLYRILDELEK